MMDNEEKGRMMSEELKGESSAEIGRSGKIRKSLFFCPTYLSAILPLAPVPPGRLAAPKPLRRRRVKPNQSESNQFCWLSRRPDSHANP
jgi:hypothetical protein